MAVLKFVGRALLWLVAVLLWLITAAGVAVLVIIWGEAVIGRTETPETTVRTMIWGMLTAPFALAAMALTSWLIGGRLHRFLLALLAPASEPSAKVADRDE